MSIFLASDHHFFHSNIIKYCSRPFSDAEHMNVEMEKRWNDTVKHDDIIIHVGDLSAGLSGRIEEFSILLKRLHGQKILVMGNHDHQKRDFYVDCGFKKVCRLHHSQNIMFHHVPPQSFQKHRGFIDLYDELKPRLLIHGHDHGLLPDHVGQFNCAMDRHDFFPVTLEKVLLDTGNVDLTGEAYTTIEEMLHS